MSSSSLPIYGPARTFTGFMVLRRFAGQPSAVLALAFIGIICVVAIGADILAPEDPYRTRVALRLTAVGTPDRWLGGDELGRDILSRLIFGARISLMMAVVPVFVALLIGGLLGIVAGYVGGAVNSIIMRCMDVFYAFPSVLLAVAVAGALGPGIGNAIIALIVMFIPPITRIAESATTQIREHDFLIAARLTGAGNLRIIGEQVLPNVAGPILAFSASQISVSIITASGLGFLGLGVSPPEPEWGSMLAALRQAIYVNPLTAILPGLMIFLVSVAFNVATDGLVRAFEIKR